MVTKGASPVEGMPRTKMFEVALPPELSTHTPGTAVNTSPVVFGPRMSMALGLSVVTE